VAVLPATATLPETPVLPATATPSFRRDHRIARDITRVSHSATGAHACRTVRSMSPTCRPRRAELTVAT
jgi:hypothetical protein